MNSNKYRPYRKPDNIPIYENCKSYHPSTILKQHPKAISKRISDISSDENVFQASIPTYGETLQKSGFNERLIYKDKNPDNNTGVKKSRKRKIIWFNPPYCMSVKTNVGKIFLQLIKKHFPKGKLLNKIFNKNTVKISYSCMGNIASIISGHNKNILETKEKEVSGCSCRNKERCLLENKCLTPKIVYRATWNSLEGGEMKYRRKRP